MDGCSLSILRLALKAWRISRQPYWKVEDTGLRHQQGVAAAAATGKMHALVRGEGKKMLLEFIMSLPTSINLMKKIPPDQAQRQT